MIKQIFICVTMVAALSGCIVTDDIAPEDLNNPNSGLTLHLAFDNQDANDSSGYGHHGVISGSGSNFITNTPNGSGYSYNIVDANGLLRIPYNPFKDIEEYSVCFWLRDPSQGLIMNAYGNDVDSSSANYPVFHISDNLFYAAFASYSIDDYFNYDPARTLQNGSWHHIAITAKDGEQRMYVNGNLVAQQQASLYTSRSSEVHFGGVLHNYSGAYMKIDNIRIYSRAILDSEVKLIIEQEK